ncbi:hypothetical protein [Gemmata sp.]|uniref:hypothetical protein n=1 Tax=Gemmata sp. TaxID=1914242 RepID=UPI003F6FB8FB
MYGFVTGAVLGSLFAWVAIAPAARTAPAPKAKPPIKVEAWVSKAEAVVGETLTLEQSVPGKWNPEVRSIENRVVRIGRWDATGVMVNLPAEEFREEFNAFDGLPWLAGRSGPPVPQVEVRPGRHGREFEFTPKRLGVFLIYAEWTVKGESAPWHSPPVVLTVHPPLDPLGRLVIKPEYLVEKE